MADLADDGRPAEPLMTLTEAAAATGRPPEAIRAMIRRGKLKATKGNDGRYLVAVAVRIDGCYGPERTPRDELPTAGPRVGEPFADLIPGADPAETVAGAGHFLQEDKGEELGERIASWLRG